MKTKEKTKAVVQMGVIVLTDAAEAALACAAKVPTNVVSQPPKGRRREQQQLGTLNIIRRRAQRKHECCSYASMEGKRGEGEIRIDKGANRGGAVSMKRKGTSDTSNCR